MKQYYCLVAHFIDFTAVQEKINNKVVWNVNNIGEVSLQQELPQKCVLHNLFLLLTHSNHVLLTFFQEIVYETSSSDPLSFDNFTHNKPKNSKSATVEMGLRFYRLFLCHYSGNKRSAFYFWSASPPSPTGSKALLFINWSSQMRSIGYNVIMNTHSFFQTTRPPLQMFA